MGRGYPMNKLMLELQLEIKNEVEKVLNSKTKEELAKLSIFFSEEQRFIDQQKSIKTA